MVKRMGSEFISCLKSEYQIIEGLYGAMLYLGQPPDGNLGDWACYLICIEVGNGVTFPCLDI
jgi:hypothetical protein